MTKEQAESIANHLRDIEILTRFPDLIEAALKICALKEKGYDRFIEITKETLAETESNETARVDGLTSVMPFAEALKKTRIILEPVAREYIRIIKKHR